MPIPISDFRTPKWIKITERWPLSPNRKDRFINFSLDTRHYRGANGFKQAGYDPKQQSTTIEHIKLDTDNFTLKPR